MDKKKYKMKQNLKLTKKQTQSIQYNNSINISWFNSLYGFFKQFKTKKGQRKNIQNQTFKEFKQMSLNGPNQDGTGRYSFNQIGSIFLTLIPRKNNTNKNKKQTKKQMLFQKKLEKDHKNNYLKDYKNDQILFIKKILSAFYQIPVQYHDLGLYIDNKTNKIVDRKEMIQFDIQKNKQNYFQVFSLFDLGLEYKQKLQKLKKLNNIRQNIFLFLIQANLIQGQNQIQIDGRACGNGVAFVTFNISDFQLKTCQQLSKYKLPIYTIPTLIHQGLHTLGFDHCSAWQCIMNAATNEEFWLCPCCLRKLQSQLSPRISIKQWYIVIVQIIISIKLQQQKKYGHNKQIRILDFLFNKKTQPNCLNELNGVKFFSMLQKGQNIIQSFQKI